VFVACGGPIWDREFNCYLYSINDKDVGFYIRLAELLVSIIDLREQESKTGKVV
jgi:hypothetical protein